MRFTLLDTEEGVATIDINGDYVVTGGTSLCIYKLDLITPSTVVLDPKVVSHSAPIKVVRIKPTNNSVVFGDDDGYLWYYNLEANDPPKKIYPLVQRTSRPRIVLISWSPDGHIFAFSTDDAKVWIYDLMRQTVQELTTLDKTKDKAVVQRLLAFDPTDNYLVTCGDDTMVYVYQWYTSVGNYKFRLIHKNTKLVNSVPMLTESRHIGWSPDGELVAIPLASKQQTTLISLMSLSNGWNHRVSLVGHGLGCTAVEFNPTIFTSDQGEDRGDNIYFVVASIGIDRSLAFWNTTKTTPITTLADITTEPLVDLAWHPNGKLCIVVSPGGKMGVAIFEDNELGIEASDETAAVLKKAHDVHVKPMDYKYDDNVPTGRGKKGEIIDMVDQLSAMDVTREEVVLVTGATPRKQQPEEAPEAPKEIKEEKPKESVSGEVVPEVLDADPHPANETTTVVSTTKKKKKMQPATVVLTPLTSNQKVTTKNGKKRVQPMLISNNGSTPPSIPPSNSALTSSTDQPKSPMEMNKACYAVSDSVAKLVKRTKNDDGTNKKLKRDLEPIKFIGQVVVNPNTAFAKVRLATPKIRLNILVETPQGTLDIRNGSGNETKPTRISYFKKEKQIWCDFIPRYVQLVTQSANFWAICASDGQILTYSTISGRRMIPPMVLGAPVLFLESQGPYLMAVTSIGELLLWDVVQQTLKLNTNLAPLLDLSNKFSEDGLSKGASITMCLVSNLGVPVVTLNNGSGYLYNQNMGVWQTISELWWLFGSHYWNSNEDTDVTGTDSSILDLVEHRTNDEILRKTRTGRGKYFNKINKNMMMKEGFENLENVISISHLENRMAVCELLGETTEFHKHFIAYSHRICELGLKTKLFEVCDLLWKQNKKDLLKDLVELCAKHRDVQRILLHFASKLEITVT